jgi:hypothetical protein
VVVVDQVCSSWVAAHSAISCSVVNEARSRTWSSFMPSHQNGESSSLQIGLPPRFWRKNSRGDADGSDLHCVVVVDTGDRRDVDRGG